MYSLEALVRLIRVQIDSEKEEVYSLIKYILIGFAIGLFSAWVLCTPALTKSLFISVITKISGLGISLTMIISVFYYLYKGDEIATRKSNFLGHISEQIGGRENKDINPVIKEEIIQEIVVALLKSSIAEDVKLKDEKG
jgi:hypothetical protein